MGIAIVSTQQKTATPLGPLFSNSFNNGVAAHLFSRLSFRWELSRLSATQTSVKAFNR